MVWIQITTKCKCKILLCSSPKSFVPWVSVVAEEHVWNVLGTQVIQLSREWKSRKTHRAKWNTKHFFRFVYSLGDFRRNSARYFIPLILETIKLSFIDGWSQYRELLNTHPCRILGAQMYEAARSKNCLLQDNFVYVDMNVNAKYRDDRLNLPEGFTVSWDFLFLLGFFVAFYK